MRRAALAAVFLGALACRPRPPATNVLLVSIDTLRADHLGSYGDAAAQTPRLDALAARGTRFAHAATVAPLTLPAHSSLMTGTFPAFHGVRDNGGFYLGEEQQTLAEILRGRGYRTGGFVGAFVLDSRWGIAQGFDHYFDDFDLAKYEGQGMDAVQRRGDEVVDKALAWLAEDRSRPFFAWVHLYDPHAPYAAPEPYRSRFPATLEGAYDAEIAWTDSQVGRLFDALAADGRLDRTLVVVVGDHGESLGEHKEQMHGFFVYDATVHIPLLAAGPGIPVRTVPDPVRIVDVLPTVLDAIGAPAPSTVQGESLLPLARGATRPPLTTLAETFYPRYHYGWSELRAVGDGRYTLIAAPRPELYDTVSDPGQQLDLYAQQPARAAGLQRALDGLLARVTSARAPRGPQSIDAEAEERLQALGYVASSASASTLDDRPRGDPKDKIDLYSMLKRAGQASSEARLDDAIALVREALARDPGIVEGYTLLGNFVFKQKRYAEAAAEYRKALALDPEHRGAMFSLALAYEQMGRYDDAEAGFARLRQLDPGEGRATIKLASLWMRRGRLDDAEALLREGLARRVDRPSFLVKLGECLIEKKKDKEAEAALREALAARPATPSVHYNLGLVMEQRGDDDAAAAEYRAELARDPGAYRAAFNLGKLLLRSGRATDAAAEFQKAVEAEPSFATGSLYLAKALFDGGDLQGAAEAARHGLAGRPEARTGALGHYVLADVYMQQGRPREAAREVAAARRVESGG